jgi:LysR family transcriptional regulator, regulator of abg operon
MLKNPTRPSQGRVRTERVMRRRSRGSSVQQNRHSEEGEKGVVRRATAILNDVRRAREEAEQLRGSAVGQLTVGLSIAAHLWLLPRVLEPFRRRFAHVHLHIIEGFYPTLEQGLQDGSVDFYVGPDPGQKLPRVLRKDALFAGRRTVLCRTKHPLARARSLRDLVDAGWITTSITPTADKELGALFRRYGLSEPTLALRSQSRC